MKSLLRYLDRRILAAIVLVIIAVLALRATWVGSASSSLAASRLEQTAAEEELDSFRTRLVEIRSEGVTTGEDLLNRIARLEVLVPASTDVLSVSSNFIAVADSSGVLLESFAPVDTGEGGKEEVVARVLRGTRFSFDATGDYDSLSRFLVGIISSNRFVATIDSLDVTPTGADAGMFGSAVRISGEVLVWSLIEKPLTNPVVSPAPLPAGGNSAPTTTLPVDPSAPTTLPPDAATETTLPPATTVPPAEDAPAEDAPDEEPPADDI